MMVELSDFQIGQTVEIGEGQVGSVQFVGSTQFAPGDWVGVVFEEAIGKNDGSVKGERYFDCPADHGMFVRPTVAKILEQPAPKPAARINGKANGTALKVRPPGVTSTGLKRQSIPDPGAAKRQSMNASSPTPAARVSRLANPSKSPTKQLGSTASSGTSTPSRTGAGTPSSRKSIVPPTSSRRTSMAPPPRPSSVKKGTRPSIASAMNDSTKSTSQSSSVSRPGASRPSLRPGVSQRLGSARGESRTSVRSGNESLAESLDHAVLPPAESELREDDPRGISGTDIASPLSQASDMSRATSQMPPPSRGRSPGALSQRPTAAAAAQKREIDDLETKIRLLERRREEDRERLKELDKAKADRDRFEGIIQKLQTKYQPQQQEMTDLRKQLKDAEAKLEALEAQQAESESINEMATLDKEMAEELVESTKLELHALRQKYEEIELEVEVLREENQELGQEISPEEKTSQGWLQLERSNERYREALLRLRDVTQEQEADLRDQVGNLEQELQDYAKIKEEGAKTKERLDETDAMVEDLRQQLDAALGAEDMIEELTEKNLVLNERMDELRTTIEDLEALKELNDELEINHTENEKQLQDEIDYHELLLAEEARKSAIQDGTIQDLEYTVARFRDLVTNMQSDLEDMKASQQITEAQANDLSAKSRAMMDVNMRLQTSATKTQVKAIDLELGKMQAMESAEHLAIVQLFLPEQFQSERDSIEAFLRFRRIGFKAKMLHSFVKDRISNPSTLGQEDDVFAYCDVLDKLTWVSSTCDRFVSTLETCDQDTFKRLGAASYELDPVERALNGWVDALRRDELKGNQCASELPRFIALMAHLAEVHISESLEHHADDVHLRATMTQSHLETAAAALLQLKSISDAKISSSNTGTEEEEDISMQLASRIDSLVSQVRSAKVVSSKVIRELEDLRSRCVTLDPSTMPTITASEQSSSDLVSIANQVGMSTLKLFAEAQTEPITAQTISAALQSGPTSLSPLSSKLQVVTTQVHNLYNLTTSLSQAVEFPVPSTIPPWKLLAQDMKAANTDLAAREVEMNRLKDEMTEKNTTLAMKEKLAEEMSVKLEVLEKRVGESGGRRERVRELEEAAAGAKAKEKDLLNKLTRLQSELQHVEADREKWKQSVQTKPPSVQPGQARTIDDGPTAHTSEASLREISSLKAEIKTLQSSIRYLRTAQHTQNLSDSLDFLSVPITPAPPPTPAVQQEAKDVLKEMLGLITHSDNHVVKLHSRPAADRLRWRPTRETTTWKVQRQREEWEEWRDWEDGVARKAAMTRRQRERTAEARRNPDAKERTTPLAKLSIQLPGKIREGSEEVTIVDPGEWDEVQQSLGVRLG